MTSKHIPYFSFYPVDFMNGVRGLSAQEVGVYTMLLCRIYEENGPIEANSMRLSTYCGMREKTFKAVMDRLVDLGKFTLADGRLMNGRAISEIEKRANDLKNNSIAGKASAEKRKQNQSHPSTTVEHAFNHTDTDTDTEGKEDTDVSSKSQKAALTKLRKMQFEAFWGVYPRLAGKGAAEKAFYKALETASFEQIMDGAKRYTAQRQGQDAQYTKHPATWLNQKCWLDGVGASGTYTQQPMRRGQYRIMRNGEVQHRNDEFDDWYQVDVKADAIAAIALFDYRQPLEAVG